MAPLGQRNSYLSLPANQPPSLERVAEYVHSWDQLIKCVRFLTTRPGWGALSSLSPGSTLDSLKRQKRSCLMWSYADSGGRSRGSGSLCGKHNNSGFLLSQGSGLISSNGSSFLCTCSPLVLAVPQRPLRGNNKSGHLTAGHFTVTAPTHTSSPWSFLPNLPCLVAKTEAYNCEISL